MWRCMRWVQTTMPDACADSTSTYLYTVSIILNDDGLWSATALFPTPYARHHSRLRAEAAHPDVYVVGFLITRTRHAYSIHHLDATLRQSRPWLRASRIFCPVGPSPSPPGFRRNGPPRRVGLASYVRHQTYRSLSCGDGSRARTRSTRQLAIGRLDGIHP